MKTTHITIPPPATGPERKFYVQWHQPKCTLEVWACSQEEARLKAQRLLGCTCEMGWDENCPYH